MDEYEEMVVPALSGDLFEVFRTRDFIFRQRILRGPE